MEATTEYYIYKNNYPNDISEIPVKHFHEVFFDGAKELLQKSGDFVCLELVDTGSKLLLSDMISMPRRIASALTRLGFREGDVFCTCMHNQLENYTLGLSVWLCGGCISPRIPIDRAEDLRLQLIDCSAKWLLVEPDTVEMAREALGSMPGGALNWQGRLFIVGGEDPNPNASPRCTPFHTLLKDDGEACPASLSRDVKKDVVFLPTSSGTTGLPKGVMSASYTLNARLYQGTKKDEVKRQDEISRLLMTNGMYHPFTAQHPFMTILNKTWIGLFSKPGKTDDLILPAIDKFKPHQVSLLPQQMTLLTILDHKDYDVSSVKAFFATGAIVSPHILKLIEQQYGTKAMSVYGCTEGGLMTKIENTNAPGPCNKKGNHGILMGKLGPYAQAKILDPDTGKSLGPFWEGEIAVKGPTNSLGYLKRPEESAQAFQDGWYITGDLGYFDEDGNLYYVDRLKELLKYRNMHVPPGELECILKTHPDVKDVAVIGIPDPNFGDLPRAYVSLKDGAKATEIELENFVNGQVADYKRIRSGVVFVDEIPRNKSGKAMKKNLLQVALSQK